MSIERSWTANQLLTDFASEIDSGVVVVLEDLRQAHGPLSGFPFQDVRLDFDNMTDSEWLDGSGVNLLDPDGPLDELWARRRKVHGIDDDISVIVAGDTLELALQMPAGVFTHRMRDILDFTMHWYVYPPNGAWCLNLVMLGDVYFGLRPDVLPMPWTEKKLREITGALRDAGEIQLVEASVLELLAERFPMEDGRIRWQATSFATMQKPKPRDPLHLAEGELEDMDRETVAFWEKAQAAAGIHDDTILRVGGPQVKISFGIPAKHLPALLPDITTYLQEAHLLRLEPPWCMTYLAEGGAAFGSP